MKHYFRFLGVHANYIYHYNLYYRQTIVKVMKELVAPFDDDQLPFTQQQLKRIRLYSHVGLYVNDCLATLRGRKMTQWEIKQTLYLSILTPLLDDLTDNYSFSSDQILEKLYQKDDDYPQHLRLAVDLYNHIKEENKQELFPGTFTKALISQDESLKQLNHSALNITTLFEITCAKGSLWTFLFRLMLDHPLKEGEREAIEAFGAIIQLTNDMFDVYKDVQNGQQTCFTNTRDIALMEIDYNNRLREIIQRFHHFLIRINKLIKL